MCHLQYMQFATHVICNMCSLQHVQFATCAICNMSTLQHVHFACYNNERMNFKGMHEEWTCQVCQEDNETQEHIVQECKIMNINDLEKIDYEKINHGNVEEMLEIARKLKRNMQTRDKL